MKHVGGGFGAKLNRTPAVAMACAMAADKLQKPVRLLLDLSTNMQVWFPFHVDFEYTCSMD